MSRDTKMSPTFRARETTASAFAPIAPLAFRQTRRRESCLYRISSPRKRCGFDRQLRSDRRKRRWHLAGTLIFWITLLAGGRTGARNLPACVSSPRETRRRPRALFVYLCRGCRRDRAPLSTRRGRARRRTIARRKPSPPDLAPRLRCRSYVARTVHFRGLQRR